jgi:hypothetical protein
VRRDEVAVPARGIPDVARRDRSGELLGGRHPRKECDHGRRGHGGWRANGIRSAMRHVFPVFVVYVLLTLAGIVLYTVVGAARL